MNNQTALILVIIAALLVLSYIVKREKVPDAPAPADIMDPNAWEIGPIMGGENMSKGMPLHPTAHPEGWICEIPYPNADAGHGHYFTVPTNPLTGKTKVTLRCRFEMAPGVKLCPVKSPDSPSLLTLYFQRRGDNWSMDGEYETYRWYASFATESNIEARDYILVARFDQNWTALQTSSRENNPLAFAEAINNAGRIGFVLGGGDGLGHGVYATGPCKLVVTGFVVE